MAVALVVLPIVLFVSFSRRPGFIIFYQTLLSIASTQYHYFSGNICRGGINAQLVFVFKLRSSSYCDIGE